MYQFAPGSTGVSLFFQLRDSLTGEGKTGLTASSPGARSSYTRNRSATVPITLVALGSASAAWVSGGFIELDNTNARGTYRLDIPDNVCASGVPHAVVNLGFDSTFDEGALVRLASDNGSVGPGGTAFAITVTRADTTPISGALVWITTDLAGANTIAGALPTDDFGVVTFLLNTGTYYAWIKEAGYTGTNPTTITVP